MSRLIRSLLISLSLVGGAQSASATVILDQYNTVLDSTINGGSSVYEWQQGVTAGVSGQLVRVELFVREAPGVTTVSINLGGPWQADSNDWETTAILVQGWNSFRLWRERIYLSAGTPFVIGVQGLTDYYFPPGIGISYGNVYAGGSLYLNGAIDEAPGNDMNFGTYMRVSSVPEPGSIALLATGLLAIGFMRCRAGARCCTDYVRRCVGSADC